MASPGTEYSTAGYNPTLSDISRDWTGNNRGFHVDFGVDETIPLEQARDEPLGRGAFADVFEVALRGQTLALKVVKFKRNKEVESIQAKREIEILKKLSQKRGHANIIRVIGAYTHQNNLGILLHPVAVCDLESFFADVEDYSKSNTVDDERARLTSLGYAASRDSPYKASLVYSQIGCLVSAVAFLHSTQIKIRHKDIKPSNILLTPEGIYLSDFGISTDFSRLTQSATDGGAGGTLRYSAPEAWTKAFIDYKLSLTFTDGPLELSGRAADIFSLGCVLVEILVLHREGTRERLRNRPLGSMPEMRPTQIRAFHENLDLIDDWFSPMTGLSPRRHYLYGEVRAMLSAHPDARPTADQILYRLGLADAMVKRPQFSMFGPCCRGINNIAVHQEEVLSRNRVKLEELQETLQSSAKISYNFQSRIATLEDDLIKSQMESTALKRGLETSEAATSMTKQKLARQAADLESAFKKIGTYQHDLTITAETIDALRVEYTTLERRVHSSDEITKGAISDLQRTKAELKDVQTRLAKADDTAEVIKQEHAWRRKEYKKRVSNKKSELRQAEDRINGLKHERSKLTEEVANSKSLNAENASKLGDLKRNLAVFREENKDLRDRIHASTSERRRLEDRLSQVRAELKASKLRETKEQSREPAAGISAAPRYGLDNSLLPSQPSPLAPGAQATETQVPSQRNIVQDAMHDVAPEVSMRRSRRMRRSLEDGVVSDDVPTDKTSSELWSTVGVTSASSLSDHMDGEPRRSNKQLLSVPRAGSAKLLRHKPGSRPVKSDGALRRHCTTDRNDSLVPPRFSERSFNASTAGFTDGLMTAGALRNITNTGNCRELSRRAIRPVSGHVLSDKHMKAARAWESEETLPENSQPEPQRRKKLSLRERLRNFFVR